MAEKLATIDSKVYKHTFYGILNAQGDFWTPLPFESPEQAEQHLRHFWQHLRHFWRNDPDNLAKCLRTHRIVPVRVTLEQLPDEGTTPNG